MYDLVILKSGALPSELLPVGMFPFFYASFSQHYALNLNSLMCDLVILKFHILPYDLSPMGQLIFSALFSPDTKHQI